MTPTKTKPTVRSGGPGGNGNKRASKPSCRAHPTPGGAQRQVYQNERGRVVATLRGDTLYKPVHASRHFLRTPPAIAFDAVILEAAERDGAVFVEVLDRDSGATYRAPMADLRAKGFPFDRGHGKQVALPLACWQKQTPAKAATPQPEPKPAAPQQWALDL